MPSKSYRYKMEHGVLDFALRILHPGEQTELHMRFPFLSEWFLYLAERIYKLDAAFKCLNLSLLRPLV